MEIKKVKIDEVVENSWNPNEMSDEKFNLLVKSIEEEGYIEPIQVVRSDELGKYLIINGEHRFRAAKMLGYEEIEVIDLGKDIDEDKMKALTVRLNVLKGELNPIKFAKLVEEFSKKFGKEEIKDLMGFTDEQIFEKVYNDIVKTLPKEIKKEVEKRKKEIKTVEQLTGIISELFEKYGDTIEKNYMWFAWGGKKHILIECDDELWKKICKLEKENEDDFVKKIKDAIMGIEG